MSQKFNNFLSTLQSDIDGGPQDGQGDTGLGYAAGLTKETARNAWNSSAFVQDVFDYYQERDGKTFKSTDEARDYFMEDRRWRNMNTISIGRDIYDSKSQSDAQNLRLARLQTTFDAMPDFYEEGGDGWQGFGTNAAAGLLDIINLVGFGSGGVAARAAAAGVMAKAGTQSVKGLATQTALGKAKKAGIRAGLTKGATSEALAGGLVEGVHSLGTQSRDIKIGLQDKYSLMQTGAAIGGGLIGGAVLGAPMGLAGALVPNVNPLSKGFGKGNAIGRGIRDGRRSAFRADLDARQTAAAEAKAAAETAEPEVAQGIGTEANKTRLTEVFTARANHQRTQELQSQVMEDGLDADGNKTVDVGTSSTVETSASQRFLNAVKAMNDSVGLATKYDAKAQKLVDAGGDEAKIAEARDLAERHRAVADNIEVQLQIIDSPNKGTADVDIKLLEDLTKQQKRIGYTEGVGNAADNTMNPAVGEGFTVEDNTQGEGRTLARDVDNAAGQAQGKETLAAGERNQFKGGGQPSDTAGERLSDVNESAIAEREAAVQKALREQVEAAGEKLPELDEAVEAATRELKEADRALTKEQVGTDADGNPVEKVTNAPDSPEIKAFNEKRAALADAQKAADDQRAVQDAVKEKSAEATKVFEQDRVARQAARVAEEPVEEPEVKTPDAAPVEVVVTATERITNIVDMNTNAESRLAVLQLLVDNIGGPFTAKQLAEQISSIKKNTKAAIAARKAKFQAILEEYAGRSDALELLNEEDGIAASALNNVVFETLLDANQAEKYGDATPYRAGAMAEYNAWLEQEAIAIYRDRELDGFGLPDEVLASMAEDFTPEFADVARAAINNPEVQRVEFTPAKKSEIKAFVDDLPAAMKSELNEFREKYLSSLLASGEMRLADAERIVNGLAEDKVDKWMRRSGDFAERNQQALTNEIENNRNIRREFTVALEKMLQTFKPSLAEKEAGKSYRKQIGTAEFRLAGYDFGNILASPGGDLVGDAKGAKRVKFRSSPTKDATPAQEAHMAARARVAALIDKYGFKRDMTVSKIISILDERNAKLQKSRKRNIDMGRQGLDDETVLYGPNKGNRSDSAKKLDRLAYESTSTNPIKDGRTIRADRGVVRSSKAIGISDEAAALGHGAHIGYTQVAPTGKMTVWGKTVEGKATTAQLAAVFGKGKGGKLFRKTTVRNGQTGKLETLNSQVTAQIQILDGAIDAASEQRISNPVKAKRNLPYTKPRIAAIEKLDKAINKLKNAQNPKPSKKNPEAVVDPQKVADAQDALDTLHSQLRIATFFVDDPSLKKGTQILVDPARLQLARQALVDSTSDASTITDAQVMRRALKSIVSDFNSSTKKEAAADNKVEYLENEGLKSLMSEYNALRNKLYDVMKGKLEKQPDGSMARTGDKVAMEAVELQRMRNTFTKLGYTLQTALDTGAKVDSKVADDIISAPGKERAKAARVKFARDKAEGDQATRDAAQEAAMNERRNQANPYDEAFQDFGHITDPDLRAELEADAFNAAVTANLNNRAGNGPDMTPEDYALMAGVDPNDVKPIHPATKAAVKQKADSIMQEEAASVEMGEEIAEALSIQRENGLPKEWLQGQIKQIRAHYAKKTKPVTEPNSVPPTSKGRPPYIRVIDGIEIDLFNDLDYVDLGDGRTSIRFEGFMLGAVDSLPDGKAVFTRASDSTVRVFDSKKDLIDDLLPMFRESFNIVADKMPNKYTRKSNQVGTEYPIDHKNSEIYGNNKPLTPNTKKGETPLDTPAKPVDPADRLTHNGEYYAAQIPTGKMFAVQIVDETSKLKGSVRATSMKKPQSAGDMLKNSSRYQFIFGHVDLPATGISRKDQLIETFRPMDANDSFYNRNGKLVTVAEADAELATKANVVPDGSKAAVNTKASKLSKIAGNPINGSKEDIAVLAELATVPKTIGELNDMMFGLESITWDKMPSVDSYKNFMRLRAAVGSLMNSSAKNGIDRETARRVKTNYNQLQNALSEHAPDDLAASVSFLENLFTFTGKSPLIEVGDENTFTPDFANERFGSKRNRITLDKEQINAGGNRHTPITATIIHETGHWLYANVLDETDKVQFWSAMEKFYKDAEAGGGLDENLLRTGSVDPQLFTNSLSSPSEYFANQFLTWVTSNGQVNNISLWGKVAQLGAMLLNNLLGRETPGVQLDPDLVPIFQKHMPVLQPDPVTGKMNVGISRFAHLQGMGAKFGKPMKEGQKRNTAAFLGEKIALLDTTRLTLLGAKMRTPASLDDSLSLATDMETAKNKIYGMFGGKAGEETHYFNPLQEGSGNVRITMFDTGTGSLQRGKLLEAQHKVHVFLKALRENKKAFNPDIEETKQRDDEIRKLIEDGGTPDEATEAKIREDSPYDNLDEKIIQQMDLLATNLNNAMDVMNRQMLAAFNRQMPRDAKTDLYIGITFEGQAEVRKVNRKSERFKKLAREDAAEYQSKKEALDLIIAQYNNEGLDIGEVAPDDLAAMVDEVAVPVAPIEALKRHVVEGDSGVMAIHSIFEAIQEMGARPDLKAMPTMQELYKQAMAKGDFAKKILAELTTLSKNGERHKIVARLAKAATELGDPLWIQIALRWKTDPKNIGIKHEGVYTPSSKPAGDKSGPFVVAKGAMTYRRADVQTVLQSLWSNFHNAGISNVEEPNKIVDTEYTAHVVTGFGPNKPGNDEVVLDQDGALFKEMRKTLRKMAVKITRVNDARLSNKDTSTKGLDEKKDYITKNLYEDVLPDLYMMAYRMLSPSQQKDINDAAQVSYADANTTESDTLDFFVTRAMRQTNSGVKPDIGKVNTFDDRLRALLKRQYEDSSQNQALGGTFTYDPPKFAVADVENGLKEIGQIVFDLTQDILAFPKDTIAFKRDYDEANKWVNSGEDLFLLSPTKEEVAIARTPVLMAAKSHGSSTISPTIAGRFGRELTMSMSEKMQATVRTFLGASPFENVSTFLRFNKSPQADVNGVTRTSDGPFGDGVYMSKAAEADAEFDEADFLETTKRTLQSSPLSEADIDGGMASAEAIVFYRERILDLMNRSQDQNGVVNHELKHFLTMQDQHWRLLGSLDASLVQPKVVPVFAKISTPFDLTSSSSYSFRNDAQDGISYLIGRMVNARLINFGAVEELMDSVTDTFSGAALHRTLTGRNGLMVKHGTATDEKKARQAFNAFMSKQGYDALTTDIGDVVFSSASVRQAEGGFTPVDATYSTNPTINFNRKVAGSLAEEMAVINGELPPGMFANLAQEAQRLELPVQLVPVLGKMFKKQDVTEADAQKVSKLSSVVNFFSENAAHFRNVGANWYADKIKPQEGAGFFEEHDVELHNTVNSVFQKLNVLPDAGGRIKKWANRNRGLMLKDAKQPASHARIISALRRGRGAVQNLAQPEREIALEIGRLFDAELQKMRALGISVGDARNLGNDFYVPQVWDVDELLANPNRFKDALVTYFKREQNSPDYQGQKRHSIAELEEKADNVHYRLTQGHDPSVDTQVQKALGSIFAPRVLQLQAGDMPEMDNFLVTDLQGIMSKYFDRTVRKRLLTERFGLNMHGFDTYLDVARGATMSGKGNGLDRAVEILRSTKHTSSHGQSKEGPLQVDTVTVPSVKGRGDVIKDLLVSVQRELGDTPEKRRKNKHRARAMLINAVDGSDRDDVGYNVRVDAIINAMIDFPNSNRLTHSNETKMRDMMNVLNKRSIDGGDGTELRYVVSRNMKAFNSVSLLGFTTLTSMPDMVLPLIRSGDMKAFYTAWKGYVKKDPAYRDAARNIGVGIENLMHDRAVQQSGAGNQKFTNSFFNFTGLTGWTNINREVSAMVGFESFKTEINRALAMRAKGQRGSKDYETSIRYLKRYGLTGEGAKYDFLKHGAIRLDELPPSDEAIKKQVQMSMLRFTNESVFMPNPNDTPLWAQNPWQSMMWQLKSFPLMMARLSGYVISEAKAGNVKPAMYLLTAGVGMGSLSVMTKDVVQMRGGEDERSMALRERKGSDTNMLGLWSMAQALGAKEGGDADQNLGLYIDGLLAVGGLGLFAELLYNASAQMDNGAYGTVRIASSVFGPSVSAGSGAIDVATGLKDYFTGDGENTAKRRAMLRQLAMRFPVLGGVSFFRESAADLGGEPNTGGRKSSSFGGGLD